MEAVDQAELGPVNGSCNTQDSTPVTNSVNFSSWYIYIQRDFTPLVNGLKSYSMNTDTDSGVKSYSL